MEKNVILCRLLIKERTLKKIQDGFLKDNVIHIPCVSELQCLVDLGEKKSFFDPGEKTLTQTHLGTTNIARQALCFTVPGWRVEGYCLLIYQQHRGIWNTTHCNMQTLSPFCGNSRQSHCCLGPTQDPGCSPRAQKHVPAHPSIPVATDHEEYISPSLLQPRSKCK